MRVTLWITYPQNRLKADRLRDQGSVMFNGCGKIGDQQDPISSSILQQSVRRASISRGHGWFVNQPIFCSSMLRQACAMCLEGTTYGCMIAAVLVIGQCMACEMQVLGTTFRRDTVRPRIAQKLFVCAVATEREVLLVS